MNWRRDAQCSVGAAAPVTVTAVGEPARRTWRPRPGRRAAGEARPRRRARGTWPSRTRSCPAVDLGSLQVPVLEGTDIQLVFAEQHGAWVTVRHELSELQLQAFAAPKRDSAVGRRARRDRRRRSAARAGRSRSATGPVRRRAAPTSRASRASRRQACSRSGSPAWTAPLVPARPVRRRGRGEPAAAAPLEAVFREVVVVRGEHPVPPRDLLELRLPPEAAAGLEEQARAQQEPQRQRGTTASPPHRPSSPHVERTPPAPPESSPSPREDAATGAAGAGLGRPGGCVGTRPEGGPARRRRDPPVPPRRPPW